MREAIVSDTPRRCSVISTGVNPTTKGVGASVNLTVQRNGQNIEVLVPIEDIGGGETRASGK